jgi:hypothetical protein
VVGKALTAVVAGVLPGAFGGGVSAALTGAPVAIVGAAASAVTGVLGNTIDAGVSTLGAAVAVIWQALTAVVAGVLGRALRSGVPAGQVNRPEPVVGAPTYAVAGVLMHAITPGISTGRTQGEVIEAADTLAIAGVLGGALPSHRTAGKAFGFVDRFAALAVGLRAHLALGGLAGIGGAFAHALVIADVALGGRIVVVAEGAFVFENH